LKDVKKIDNHFEELVDGIILISDYYISSSYPNVGDFFEYSKENAIEAYEVAKKVFNFVNSKLKSSKFSVN
jgi:HEPN domain-containing protein